MTYCCGILVRDGLVMIADTRTNAGLDNISTFRKLHLFERPGERVLMLAASGNLSVTQGVVNLIGDGIEHPESGVVENVMNTPNMLHAAQLVGRAVRLSRVQTGNAEGEPAAQGVSFDVSLLLGGQIAGGPLRLFMIYTAGNSIECTPDTNYLQIGEHKYGKPILDRAVTYDTDIYDALKIGLISMDSTMRSNLSVGTPIDIALLRRDALQMEVATRIGSNDPYFRDLRESWSKALREAHMAIPKPPYSGRNA
ncbi:MULTISPECIES: peptidase [Methylocystis]|uniref:Peptidase n=1 Tax=Methylocystis rosea TaxID=173366 RepID=A0ABX6EFH1_9HYPH|nr:MULTISPECIES: peptidase [Methylocystis]PWB89399.1 peptidase [Methylocystis sp. MitZ-2018]QGM92850.1 peptidase [Methylocystis rosea]ULO23812.1 peptidase [Methylocystis sp. SB2]